MEKLVTISMTFAVSSIYEIHIEEITGYWVVEQSLLTITMYTMLWTLMTGDILVLTRV